jgi:vacuolar-type H+-ATPase subunit H
MTDERQLERFGEAVEQKKEEAKRRSEEPREESHDGAAIEGDQENLITQGNQDVRDERKKNAGHGKKTADKWNQ